MTDDFKRVGGLIEQHEKLAHCDEHGDYTSVGYKLARKIVWMNCPQCSDRHRLAEEAERAEREAHEAQQRMESRLNQAGIPLRYRDRTFASFVADTDAKERALSVAMEFAQNFDQHYRKGSTLVFSGLPGTGKSHLAIAIAQAVMGQYTALYTSAIDAVRMVRDTWRRDSPKTEKEVIATLSGIGLLILDEIGVQFGTDAEQVTLFDIIDKRYRDLMPTILLTNLDKEGMKKFLGDRSFDRLREDGRWVSFEWQSYRGTRK